MPAPTDVVRDVTWMHKSSSGLAAFQEVETTGDDLGTPATVYNFGYIEKSVYDRKPSIITENDQGTKTFKKAGPVEASMTMKIKQRDTPHLNLGKTLEGVPVRIYQELNDQLLDGKVQVLIVANALIQPGMHIDGTDMYPEPVFDARPVETADVIVLTTGFIGTYGASVGSVTIPVGDYEKIYEYEPA